MANQGATESGTHEREEAWREHDESGRRWCCSVMATGQRLVWRGSNCGAGAGGLRQAVCMSSSVLRPSKAGIGVCNVVMYLKESLLGRRGRGGGEGNKRVLWGASGVRVPGACRSPLLPLLCFAVTVHLLQQRRCRASNRRIQGSVSWHVTSRSASSGLPSVITAGRVSVSVGATETRSPRLACLLCLAVLACRHR